MASIKCPAFSSSITDSNEAIGSNMIVGLAMKTGYISEMMGCLLYRQECSVGMMDFMRVRKSDSPGMMDFMRVRKSDSPGIMDCLLHR